MNNNPNDVKLGSIIRVHFDEDTRRYTDKLYMDYVVSDIRRFGSLEVELLHEESNNAFWFNWRTNYEILKQ